VYESALVVVGLSCIFVNFQNMLMNINRNDPNQVVELQEIPQSCIDVFPLFLKYFYTGRMSLEKSIIMPILLLAEKYEVEVCYYLLVLFFVSSCALN